MKKIAVVGPESTGKSTLSKMLADELEGLWIPEYARIYLEANGLDYKKADVENIAKHQYELEKSAEEVAQNQWIVCDTNLLVIKVWMQYKYNDYPKWIDQKLKQETLYILSKPDMPWVSDPLRENPHNRDELYEIYFDLLKKSGAQFTEVEGNEKQRLTNSLKWLSQFQ
ncbi:MAG: ATP-binding protein [Chitinophagales bacterium]